MKRFLELLHIFLSYRVYKYFPNSQYFLPLFFISPWSLKQSPASERNLKKALEKMGPIYIKLGQFLSTRRDLFSAEVIQSMLDLQDNVTLSPPEYFETIIQQIYVRHSIVINKNPVAAASIAHVYFGVLHSGHPVAIKIRRPELQAMVDQDLRVIKIFIYIFSWVLPKRLRIKHVFERFKDTLLHEVDFMREAAQGDALAIALKDYAHHLTIPKIYWEFSSSSILVMDRATGEKFNTLIDSNTDAQKIVAKKLYQTFLHSVFRHGIFHADMHPGNIFFDRGSNKLTFVDFGIVCRLSPITHKFISKQVFALLKKDYVSMADSFIIAGWTPKGFSDIDRKNFEWSLHILCAPWMDKSLEEISLAYILQEIIKIARTYQINVQPELVLLHKTLFVIEGLVRSLNPQVNLIREGYGEVMRSIHYRYGLQSYIRKLLQPL